MKKNIIVILLLFLLIPVLTYAGGGTTDYTRGAKALRDMNIFVAAMATQILSLIYVVSAILSIVSATHIYLKLQSGEQGFMKSVIILIGSCVYILIATILLPKFFGLNYGP